MSHQNIASAAQITADRLQNACFSTDTSAVGAQTVISLVKMARP
jgi:hypothetical protein